jgi:hypothetical protein
MDAYDGGFTDPLPCPPEGVTYCVRVQAQPFGDPPSGVTPQALAQLRLLSRLARANGTVGSSANSTANGTALAGGGS